MSVARWIVLDALALLARALNERGADTIGTLLPVVVIPAPHLIEVLHRAPEWGHRMTAEELGEHIQAMGLAVEPFTGMTWYVPPS